jgi:anti-sigma28 factor (negative regulator of flagellin synthesis)
MKRHNRNESVGSMEHLPVLNSSNVWTWVRAMKYKPKVRQDKVKAIREKIASGQYDEFAKVEVVAEAIFSDYALIGAAKPEGKKFQRMHAAKRIKRSAKVMLTAGSAG